MSSYRRSILGGTSFVVSVILLILSFAFSTPGIASAQAVLIERISAGSGAIGGGTYASISGDGRYVAFESSAPDLAPNHLDSSWDTYVRDRLNTGFQRVSTRSDGSTAYNEGDYTSSPRISASARYVVFVSRAEDLVNNDSNGMPDIFVKDRQTGLTRLVSINQNGQSGNADSYNPEVSSDGRFVAFESYSSNLVPGDTNNSPDIFIRDMQNGLTERVSVSSSGQQGSDPHDVGGFSSVAISNDGQLVAFSYQSLPVSGQTGSGPFVYLRNRSTHTTQVIAPGEYPALTGDGRFLAFFTSAALLPADTNNAPDVYLFDRQSSKFERISVTSSGKQVTWQAIQSAPALSADGNKVVFESSSDSLAPDDVNGQTDIFLRNRTAKTTTLVSASPAGGSGNGGSYGPAISSNGSAIAFYSTASNLVPDDTNNRADVFVFGASALGSVLPTHLYLPVLAH